MSTPTCICTSTFVHLYIVYAITECPKSTAKVEGVAFSGCLLYFYASRMCVRHGACPVIGPRAQDVLRKGLCDLNDVCKHTLETFEVLF